MGLAVIGSAWGLLKDALALNLDAVPKGIDLAQVEAVLVGLPGVGAVDDLHVWGLSTSRAALTAHLRWDGTGLPPSGLLALAEERLAAIGIGKATLQLDQPELPLNPTETRP